MGNLTNELDEIIKKQRFIVDEEAATLFAELQDASPVITSQFKRSWHIVEKKNSFQIKNDMEYASILWYGRRMVAGKMIGSEKWSDGGEPMLQRTREKIQIRFNQL